MFLSSPLSRKAETKSGRRIGVVLPIDLWPAIAAIVERERRNISKTIILLLRERLNVPAPQDKISTK